MAAEDPNDGEISVQEDAEQRHDRAEGVHGFDPALTDWLHGRLTSATREIRVVINAVAGTHVRVEHGASMSSISCPRASDPAAIERWIETRGHRVRREATRHAEIALTVTPLGVLRS